MQLPRRKKVPFLQGIQVFREATRKITILGGVRPSRFVDIYRRADPNLRENDGSGPCKTFLHVYETSYPIDSIRQHCSYAKSSFPLTDLHPDSKQISTSEFT